MKKNWILKLTVIAVIGILFAACSDDNKDTLSPFEDLVVADDDTDTDATFEAIDTEVDIAFLEQNGNLGRAKSGSCPVVVVDSVNHVVTLDFGETNCTRNRKEFRGKIIINYTSRPTRVGASKIITFDNFFVNDNKVEGTRTIENTRLDNAGGIEQKVTLVGGKITLTDDRTITREADWTRTWLRGDTTTVDDDEFHLDGTANGKTRRDVNYNVEIMETLVWKRECKMQGIHLPASGIKKVSADNRPTRTIDFGDGTCDRQVVITIDGNSRTVDLGR